MTGSLVEGSHEDRLVHQHLEQQSLESILEDTHMDLVGLMAMLDLSTRWKGLRRGRCRCVSKWYLQYSDCKINRDLWEQLFFNSV